MEKALKKSAPIFVLPTLIAFIIGFIVPFGQGLYLSFCKFTTVNNAEWVGLSNYKAALTDASFGRSFVFTVLFAAVSILTINVIAFGLAVLLTQKIKGTNIFRTVFFMPNLIGGIVLGYIWQILINCVLTLVEKPLLALNSTAGYWGLIILMASFRQMPRAFAWYSKASNNSRTNPTISVRLYAKRICPLSTIRMSSNWPNKAKTRLVLRYMIPINRLFSGLFSFFNKASNGPKTNVMGVRIS